MSRKIQREFEQGNYYTAGRRVYNEFVKPLKKENKRLKAEVEELKKKYDFAKHMVDTARRNVVSAMKNGHCNEEFCADLLEFQLMRENWHLSKVINDKPQSWSKEINK